MKRVIAYAVCLLTSAIFAFPFALVAIVIAEWARVRSWIYYVIAGLAIALGGFGAEYLNEVAGQPSIVNEIGRAHV